MKNSKNTFKPKVRAGQQTKAQKMQTQKQRQARKSQQQKRTQYGTKANKPYTRRQAYKLEKAQIDLERAMVGSKSDIIKSVGQSVAMNTAPATASYAATAGSSKTNDTSVNQLINGGVGQAGMNNEEEELDYLPGGAGIR